MRTLRKILLTAFLLALAAAIAFTALIYFNKDRIIKAFIEQANQQLNTPVKVRKIDISVWTSFPSLTITATGVYVEDSSPEKAALLTAEKLSFSINPVEAWRGIYIIRGIRLEDSDLHLHIDKTGANNYRILKPGEGYGKALSLELRDVHLDRTHVVYEDESAGQYFDFSGDNLRAGISTAKRIYNISAEGDVTINTFTIGSTSLLTGKTFAVNTTLGYDDTAQKLDILKGSLQLHESTFNLSGTYAWLETKTIAIGLEGKDTNIQTLLSLLPENVATNLRQYESMGDVYFTLKIKGRLDSGHYPSLSSSFGFHNATLVHPGTGARIEQASMEGSFATPSVGSVHQAVLVLKDVQGLLDEHAFQLNLVVDNFDDPQAQFQLKGTFDLASVLNFYPISTIQDPKGLITADIHFGGKTAWLKSRSTIQRITAGGAISADGISFEFGALEVPVRDLRGSFHFTGNDLALSDVSGALGDSDFKLNGLFRNLIAYVLFPKQPIGIEADLSSRYLSLDQIFTYVFAREGADSSVFAFRISPAISMNFNYDVNALRYKRFHANSVKGNLLVKNAVAVTRGISMKGMGGGLSLTGIIDAHKIDSIDVVSSFRLNGVHIDSVFYVFQNFNQNFIEDRHLRGQAYADVNLEMTFDDKLNLLPETLVADIGLVIRNGQLNGFEPLRKLDRYLNDEGLNHLVFADLHNDIHIERKTVYIPQMEVRSNVTVIRITGTHTFDQHIDYRVIAPLWNKRRVNLTEAGSAYQEDRSGARLYLKITGTTDDYKIAYDFDAVKEKIIKDIKNEAQELKEAFQTRGQMHKKELELSDEVFDWDESPDD